MQPKRNLARIWLDKTHAQHVPPGHYESKYKAKRREYRMKKLGWVLYNCTSPMLEVSEVSRGSLRMFPNRCIPWTTCETNELLKVASSAVWLKGCPIELILTSAGHVITSTVLYNTFATFGALFHYLSSNEFTHVCFRSLSRVFQPLVFADEAHDCAESSVPQTKASLARTIDLNCWRKQIVLLQMTPPLKLYLQFLNFLRQRTRMRPEGGHGQHRAFFSKTSYRSLLLVTAPR